MDGISKGVFEMKMIEEIKVRKYLDSKTKLVYTEIQIDYEDKTPISVDEWI